MHCNIVNSWNLAAWVKDGLICFCRCFYQKQGARDYSKVIFKCPDPGIRGDVVTFHNMVDRIDILEIEVLGKFIGCLVQIITE